jgi:hypothetical protein
MGVGISIANCDNGIIGGDNVEDTNYFTGFQHYGIALYNNKNIRITKNSLFCNDNGIIASSNQVAIPVTKITAITSYSVTGTTLANSLVEVFITRVCLQCDNGKTFLGSTQADAAGNWTFNSSTLLDGAVTATGTSPSGATGQFAHPRFTSFQYAAQMPTCLQNNGFIHGMSMATGTRFYWLRNQNGNVDTLFTEEINNLGPGMYKFVVEQGPYCSVNFQVYLNDNTPKIYGQNVSITQPSCGANNGKIMYHNISGSYNKITWKNAGGTVVGNSVNLENVGAGQYQLIIADTTYGCSDTSVVYTLTNQSGPVINTANPQITAATCSGNNGSILGITTANTIGTVFIQWVDASGNAVGSSLNLTNANAGAYRLKLKDAGGCDTITTGVFTIPDLGGITIDASQKIIMPSNCSGSSGSIRQMLVTGGNTYIWKNTSSNTIVGSTLDILNIPSGNYMLTVSNSNGCTKNSAVIFVPQAAFAPIGITTSVVKNALCLQPVGSISITGFSTSASSYTFRWVDSTSGQQIGTGLLIQNLNAGTYFLMARDSNSCEKKIFNASIQSIPPPQFDYSTMRIKNTHCGFPDGSLEGIRLVGLSGPTTYAWTDQQNQVVGNAID